MKLQLAVKVLFLQWEHQRDFGGGVGVEAHTQQVRVDVAGSDDILRQPFSFLVCERVEEGGMDIGTVIGESEIG